MNRYVETRVQVKYEDFISQVQTRVKELARTQGLPISQVRLLHPVHQCAFVGDEIVYVAMSIHELGGISYTEILDWSGEQMNLATAFLMTERDLGYNEAFGFQFLRVWLDLEGDSKKEAVVQIAEKYIEEEVEHIDRLNRVVKLNPIFHGRNFLVDDKLAFVLSPFGEPFDTIYKNHLKPTVERIQGFRCRRADDINNNQPIIEDIWKHINEARLLIAELTDKNVNVFYETGIAHTIGKDVIFITQAMEDVPFDLSHIRCIVYKNTEEGIILLKGNLENTIRNITIRG